MSRENRLSFIRADVYEPLRERMMLGLHIGLCQLSKLYAYNALLFTSGARYNDDTIFSDKRIIVIKNPKSIIKNVPVVTVCSDDSTGALRKYTRAEEVTDIRITEFDGEGFVSPRLADRLEAEHNSFQIRMPYIKGVVHRVDFAALLSELDVPYIVDMWGKKHSPAEVDIILTESIAVLCAAVRNCRFSKSPPNSRLWRMPTTGMSALLRSETPFPPVWVRSAMQHLAEAL